jgi:HAD superfamily hydrolase (TIGR01509 family)
MFDAVIFDWDGTLADTKHVIVQSFQQILRGVGCKISDNFIERRIGVGPRKVLKDALKAVEIPFDEEIIDKLEKEKIKLHLELSNNINLFEGVRELLNSLKDDVKIALATMSNRSIIDRLLIEKGVRKYFDIVISFDEVKKPKPDPEIFLKCALKLKCQYEKCVVIEDSIFGIMAAKKANMKCIAIPSGAYSKEELMKENPDLIINSIKEKQKILEFIINTHFNSSN